MKTFVHRQTVQGLSAADIWAIWTDVNAWPLWQDDLESAHLDGPMAEGKSFALRPQGGPNVQVQLLNVEPGRNFTDLTRFPLAELRASHDIVAKGDALELVVTLEVTGLLAFLWTRLVVSGIARGQQAQLQALVARTRERQAEAMAA